MKYSSRALPNFFSSSLSMCLPMNFALCSLVLSKPSSKLNFLNVYKPYAAADISDFALNEQINANKKI